jgi:hypothetical protein
MPDDGTCHPVIRWWADRRGWLTGWVNDGSSRIRSAATASGRSSSYGKRTVPLAESLWRVDVHKQVRYAQFQYHGWYQPWFDAPDQWNAPLTEWVAAMSKLECSDCRR